MTILVARVVRDAPFPVTHAVPLDLHRYPTLGCKDHDQVLVHESIWWEYHRAETDKGETCIPYGNTDLSLENDVVDVIPMKSSENDKSHLWTSQLGHYFGGGVF